MSESLYALAVLACPVGMGAMMWMMMRDHRKPAEADTVIKQAEVTALRAQLDQLQAQQQETSRSAATGDRL